ncbi:tail assembly chaperone [uncultured Streptococcus sp.]|uniref:tail assembly chaperone n=1 Tax=uncultured Streptococcus sp. TaxID=83427 RepID=UPI0020546FB2|nr:tail assembly chaperone [uncultured Streptococcus sp.]DAR76884.1 MAG TPA: tail assembly chaperone [Caudoviricetes sp.]
MQLVIKDKTYNVKFGVKFVRSLDKAYPIEQQGLKFGMALSAKIPELYAKNIASLADIIYHGTVTESPRPSLVDVETFVEEHEDLEKLFDDVLQELSESNAGKSLMSEMNQGLKK